MPVIDIHSTIVMHDDDVSVTSNPQRRFTDWSRHITSVSVDQPAIREYMALPGELLSIFSGTRSNGIDGTTAFALTQNPAIASTYRMTNTAGTAAAFRTARSYDPTGVAHTMVVNNNASMLMSIPSGNFNAQVGDAVFIPDTTTGDSASPFNVANTGFWVVIGAAATALTMVRPIGQDFNGASEAVTPSATAQVKIFSAAGVQIGDSMEVSAGFQAPTLKTYVVSQVTASWVEFLSTTPLALETGILPTVTGLVFYFDLKRFLRIEVDQEAVVRLNGDSGNTNRLSPLIPGDEESVAHFEKWGPVWQLQVLNRSTVNSMHVVVISAE